MIRILRASPTSSVLADSMSSIILDEQVPNPVLHFEAGPFESHFLRNYAVPDFLNLQPGHLGTYKLAQDVSLCLLVKVLPCGLN